jgi:hypothetical protein
MSEPTPDEASIAANDNLIDRTRTVWQPRTGRNLTDEDARQIVENVSGFFKILTEWSPAEIHANENGDRQGIIGADGGGRDR